MIVSNVVKSPGAPADGVLIVDSCAVVEFASDHAGDALGHAPAELVGRSLPSVLCEVAPDSPQDWLRHSLGRRRTIRISRRGRTSAAVELSVEAHAPAGDAHFICVVRDAGDPADLESIARKLLECMVGATAILDGEMRYVAVTDAWLRNFGFPQRDVIGERHYDVYPATPECWRDVHRRCLGGESLQAVNDSFVGRGGRTEWVNWQMRPWRDDAGNVLGIIVGSEIVTSQHEVLEALRQSEVRLARTFEAMSGGLVIHARDGRILRLNSAAERLLGSTRDQIVGRSAMDSCRHAVREDGSGLPRDEHPAMVTLRTGMPQHHQVMGVRNASADMRWISVCAEPLPASDDPAAGAVVVTLSDITRERDSFERIRALAQRLETVREDERRSAAHALHEGIAQELYAARLAVGRLRAVPNASVTVADACGLIEHLIEKCLSDVRQLANDLRPGAVALLRVAAALTAHAKFFGSVSGLRIEVFEGETFPILNEPTRLLLFRIAQEALTNVSRHASAASATVTLRSSEAAVLMDVEDDGRGIADGALARLGSLGLLGIRERIHARHGTFRIQRNPGRPGTTLSVGLPLEGAVAHPRRAI